MCICSTFLLSYCPLSHCLPVIWLYCHHILCHNFVLSSFPPVILSSYNSFFSSSYLALLSSCHPVILSSCLMVFQAYCLLVIVSLCHLVFLQAVPQHAPDRHNFRWKRRLHQRHLPGHPEPESSGLVSEGQYLDYWRGLFMQLFKNIVV